MKNLFNLRYLWLNNLCWIGFGVVDLPQEISKLQNYKITRMYVHVFCLGLSDVGVLWGVERREMLFVF